MGTGLWLLGGSSAVRRRCSTRAQAAIHATRDHQPHDPHTLGGTMQSCAHGAPHMSSSLPWRLASCAKAAGARELQFPGGGQQAGGAADADPAPASPAAVCLVMRVQGLRYAVPPARCLLPPDAAPCAWQPVQMPAPPHMSQLLLAALQLAALPCSAACSA